MVLALGYAMACHRCSSYSLYFSEKIRLGFHVNSADNSHEKQSIFSFGKYKKKNQPMVCCSCDKCLTLVLLNPDMSCFCKQCRSRSVDF